MFHMLDLLSEKPLEKMVFLGDYVDRGAYGPEVMAFLCAMKLEKPADIILLRGNHESREITTEFNFRAQMLQWFDQDVYDLCMDLFNQMPLAAIVNGTKIAVHGGIGPGLEDLDQIN